MPPRLPQLPAVWLQASSRWVASASLVHSILSRVSTAHPVAAAPQLAALLAVPGAGPPAVDSPVVRTHLRRCIPATLSKVRLLHDNDYVA